MFEISKNTCILKVKIDSLLKYRNFISFSVGLQLLSQSPPKHAISRLKIQKHFWGRGTASSLSRPSCSPRRLRSLDPRFAQWIIIIIIIIIILLDPPFLEQRRRKH